MNRRHAPWVGAFLAVALVLLSGGASADERDSGPVRPVASPVEESSTTADRGLLELATDASDDELAELFPEELTAAIERADGDESRAIRIIRHELAAPAVRSWARSSVDGYGGAWLADGLTPTVVVGSTNPSAVIDARPRVDLLARDGIAVQVVPVEVEAADLFDAARAVVALMDAETQMTSSVVVSYSANRLEYHGSGAVLESWRVAARDVAPGVQLEKVGGPLQAPATVPGGWDGRSENGCTVAYDLVRPNSRYAVLTAGHCGSAGPQYGSITLNNQTKERSWWEGDDRPYDRQIHVIPQGDVGNGKLVVPGNKSMQGIIVPVEGSTVCRYGARTAADEGITSRCTVVRGFDSYGLVELAYSCPRGDSGGPSWQYLRAVGIAAATHFIDTSPAVPSGSCFIAGAKDALNGTDWFIQQRQYNSGSDHRTIGLYREVTPERVLDDSLQNGFFTVDFSLPLSNEDVEAVVYSIKARGVGSAGFVTGYAPGTLLPDLSIVNYADGQTASNTAITPIRRSDQIVQFKTTGSARVTIDLVGYVADTSGDEPLSTHRRTSAMLTPKRLLDTRNSTPLGPGDVRSFTARGGATGVPSGATHIVANLTVAAPTATGDAVMYDQGSAPSISHLHWNAGVARANLAVVAIGSDNKVRVRNSTGTADFIVDVLGYTNAQKPNSSYGRTIPAVGGAARMYDSRLTTPLSASSPARCVNVYDFTDETGAGLPIDGLSGLWLNVTAVSPTGPGFLRVYGGASFSSHSNINFRAGDLAVANLALVKVPSFGSVCVEYGGSDSVDFIFDSVAFTREST